MKSGLRYRVKGVLGTALFTALAVWGVNEIRGQDVLPDSVPVFGDIPMTVLRGDELVLMILTTVLVFVVTFDPLYRPRPRRTLDTIGIALKRVALGALFLAAIGYFDYTYRIPRVTHIVTTGVLTVVLPIWFVRISRRPQEAENAVLVGDDSSKMVDVLVNSDLSVIGYISPVGFKKQDLSSEVRSDGGVLEREDEVEEFAEWLGGFSKLEDVLVERNVDTVVLAFQDSNREEFFGVLDTCYENGVNVKAHPDHSESVLTGEDLEGYLIDVDLEPWDWEDYLLKRLFDLGFASAGLIALSPVMLVIAVAIKLDSPGPVLYSQERTAEFGETFKVYKFRSMVPDAESGTGAKLSEEDAGGEDPRVTRVGRVLRKTHLDEIPQLWSILVGDMSVVGPRPERPELDKDIESGVKGWPNRWFVKPGLTGLAQINDVTGFEPEEKLRYDIEYIKRQSFWFDVRIVLMQIWLVLVDVSKLIKDSKRT